MTFIISTAPFTLLAFQQAAAEPPGVKYNVAFIAAVASVVVAVISAVVSYVNLRTTRRNQSALQEEQAALTLKTQGQLATLESQLTLRTQNQIEKAKSELAEKSQARLESLRAELTAKNQADIEFLRSRLGEQGKEQDARRDYLYEARKRLYKECGPVLFRLSEASENALHRIYSLARTARDGDLDRGRSWLAGHGYYLTSTLYNLLAPCAVFRLLQERLTLVDLEVDGLVKDQYLLAKWVYVSFTDDFSLAKTEPAEAYSPFKQVSPAERCAHPARYRRQGVPLGMLDRAVEGFIKTGADGAQRLVTYGEFEAALASDLAGGGAVYGVFAEIFEDFHPRTRPVLWRILIAQALLHRELLRVFRTRTPSTRPIEEIARVPDEEFDLLAWSTSKAPAVAAELRRPYAAASHYFATHLPVLFDALRQPPRQLPDDIAPEPAAQLSVLK